MYDIRQFKPALYLLIVVGITGFAMAAQQPGLWALAVGAIVFNAWLVRTNRFVPIPRLLANVVVLVSLFYVGNQVAQSFGPPILIIGQFLVLLQLIKLFEQRGNRDYAQLLILSLLLMVAASINTASLIFAVLLISYMFLSLYCCLLFHLKVETDAARKAIAVPEQEPSPAALRQDQRHLSRSMRQLTAIVSVVSLAASVAIFLLFPRNTGAGLLGPLQFRTSQALTGFSEQIRFDEVAKITQNTQVIAHVRVWRDDQPVQGTQTLLLRGLALDVYRGGADADTRTPWQWSRSDAGSGSPPEREVRANSSEQLSRDTSGERWRQEITLQPNGTSVLFAMPGPVFFKPNRLSRIKFFRLDESLQAGDQVVQPFSYEVISRNVVRELRQVPVPDSDSSDDPRIQHVSKIDLRIEQYARLPNVSGSDAQGPLAARRKPTDGSAGDASLDEQIAANIEEHLRNNFAYTLDLTDAGRREGDPLVAFLYDYKRGHCEYFAGAMALMCQSLGMKARVVVGFKCDEYNNTPGADYYIVRQSHAHAWCEVLMPDRTWHIYDPTSARDAGASQSQSLWTKAKHLFDFMEYTWANNVVAYDRESRENLMQNVETKLIESTSGMNQWNRKLLDPRQWTIPEQITTWLVIIVSSIAILFGLWYLWERWRLRRRAARFGIESLPSSDRVRLARQLGFYDDLLKMLARHGISRPRHLTPMEFTNSLSYLPNEVFDLMRRMTKIFYRIRFGGAELSPAKRHRLNAVITRIEQCMPAARR